MEVGEERGRLEGPRGSPSSLLPLPPKWLVLEGDLEIVGALGGLQRVGQQTETHTHTCNLGTHTPCQILGISWLSAWPSACAELVLSKWLLTGT